MNFDTEYLTRLRQRDPETCTSFVLSLTPLVEARLRCRFGDWSSVEDACNETFLRVFMLVDRERVRKPEQLRSFVYGVCDRVAYEEWRKAKDHIRMPHDASEPLDRCPTADNWLARRETDARLRRVLSRLEEADRRLLIELHFQERDRRQMARERGLSRVGLNVRVCRALKRLRAGMLTQESEPGSPGRPGHQPAQARREVM